MTPLLTAALATSIGILSDRILKKPKPLTEYLFWFFMIVGSIYLCLPQERTKANPYTDQNVVSEQTYVSPHAKVYR